MTILHVTRREFVVALSSAPAWPVAARGQQQPVKVWRVGYVTPASAADQVSVALF
jgi:hypothetical protein